MKVLSKSELESLIAQFPDGGIVFAGYTPDVANFRTYGD